MLKGKTLDMIHYVLRYDLQRVEIASLYLKIISAV